jgi:hypothetical protein
MAVLEGGTSAALAGVAGEAASPMHVTIFPTSYGSGGHYHVGVTSGTMAVSLGASSEIFQFRYVTAASRLAAIYRVSISACANVAAATAQLCAFRMTAARGWTVAGSGGTRLTLTGDNVNLRTSMATSEVNDAGVASTGALTAGTKTLDTSDLAAVSFGIGTGAITTSVALNLLPDTLLFDAASPGGAHPLILANQEGFVIRTGVNAFPAGMTWSFSVNVRWGEIPYY